MQGDTEKRHIENKWKGWAIRSEVMMDIFVRWLISPAECSRRRRKWCSGQSFPQQEGYTGTTGREWQGGHLSHNGEMLNSSNEIHSSHFLVFACFQFTTNNCEIQSHDPHQTRDAVEGSSTNSERPAPMWVRRGETALRTSTPNHTTTSATTARPKTNTMAALLAHTSLNTSSEDDFPSLGAGMANKGQYGCIVVT